MTVESDIRQWDGKTVSLIEVVYDKHGGKRTFVSDIIGLIKDPGYQKGASWLLKRHFETGHKINPDQIKTVYGYLPVLGCWESKLHVLQSMPYMPIAKSDKKKVEIFLRVNLTDQNKFVRAWAYNGFYELTMAFPEYQEETRKFFDMAMRDEAASVKSRIRNILKKGF